jgi:hypothetical protein
MFGDFSLDGISWDTIVILVFFVATMVWGIMRRKKQGNSKVQTTLSLMQDINSNLRVVDERVRDWKTYKRFKTGAWEQYQEKIEFLDMPVKDSLKKAFTMAADFNSRIDVARKNKSLAYLSDISAESLREPLVRSKAGIQEWLNANLQSELYNNSRRRGIFG